MDCHSKNKKAGAHSDRTAWNKMILSNMCIFLCKCTAGLHILWENLNCIVQKYAINMLIYVNTTKQRVLLTLNHSDAVVIPDLGQSIRKRKWRVNTFHSYPGWQAESLLNYFVTISKISNSPSLHLCGSLYPYMVSYMRNRWTHKDQLGCTALNH